MLAFVAALATLLGLGWWQLQRAGEKTALLEAVAEQRRAAPATALEPDGGALGHGRRVRLSGEYDNRYQWYVDNRTHQGRFGYEIITLLRPRQGLPVLINRGWLAGDPARRSRPAIAPVHGEVELLGHIYRPAKRVPVLAADTDTGDWPKLLQRIDVDAMQGALGTTLFPWTVRLEDGQAGGLGIHWQTTHAGPMRHIGYAVQWWAMAAALVAWFVYHWRRRASQRDE